MAPGSRPGLVKVLVTGSAGLIGSEAVEFFDRLGFDVHGVDNNMRADFFGPGGDTTWNRQRLEATCRRYTHHDIDIRDRAAVDDLFRDGGYELVIHAAAQPSHDLAASRPFDDFDVNATGTLNLLEAARRHTPDAVFITVSHQQGVRRQPQPAPARRARHPLGLRRPRDRARASTSRCRSTTAPTRCSGRRRSRPTCSRRSTGATSGCARAPSAAAASPGRTTRASSCTGSSATSCSPRCAKGAYTIFGYKGKQVRDQIHSADVISAFWAFAQDPRPGEAYNLGGGKANAASLLECVELVADGVRRQAPGAAPTTTGPGRRPHLLLLRHGQVPGALPRLAPGARPRRPSSRRWWPSMAHRPARR